MFKFNNRNYYICEVVLDTMKNGKIEDVSRYISYKSILVVEDMNDYLDIPNYWSFVSIPFKHVENEVGGTKMSKEVREKMVIDHSNLDDTRDHLRVEYSIEQEPEANNEQLFESLVDYLCDYFGIADKGSIPRRVVIKPSK